MVSCNLSSWSLWINETYIFCLHHSHSSGASEPKNMIYMSRLGIWGLGTPFKAFDDFLHAIEKRSEFMLRITMVWMKIFILSHKHLLMFMFQGCWRHGDCSNGYESERHVHRTAAELFRRVLPHRGDHTGRRVQTGLQQSS